MNYQQTHSRWWRDLALPILEPDSGLYQAEVLYSRLGQELAKAEQDATPFSLLMVEGQPAAGRRLKTDSVRAVAGALFSTARQDDVPARLAARSFALLLPGVEAPAATRVGQTIERILDAVLAGMEDAWHLSCLSFPAQRAYLERLAAQVGAQDHMGNPDADYAAA